MNNRIIGHRLVKARDLIPHDLNPRTHPDHQREALSDLIEEVGYARSALAYVADKHKHLPDPPLTLIDGHLRRETLTDEEITVEVLDVDDQEARKLLLSIDPLASLAGYSETALANLRDTVESSSDALHNLWASVADAQKAIDRSLGDAKKNRETRPAQEGPSRHLVVIECEDEQDQLATLKACKKQQLVAEAIIQ